MSVSPSKASIDTSNPNTLASSSGVKYVPMYPKSSPLELFKDKSIGWIFCNLPPPRYFGFYYPIK